MGSRGCRAWASLRSSGRSAGGAALQTFDGALKFDYRIADTMESVVVRRLIRHPRRSSDRRRGSSRRSRGVQEKLKALSSNDDLVRVNGRTRSCLYYWPGSQSGGASARVLHVLTATREDGVRGPQVLIGFDQTAACLTGWDVSYKAYQYT